MTIGYGVPDPYFRGCDGVLTVLTINTIFEVFLDAVLIATVKQRFSSGKSRASSVLFSDKAVLREIQGNIYFMFRVVETRETPLLECTLNCYTFGHDYYSRDDGSVTGAFFQQRVIIAVDATRGKGRDSNTKSGRLSVR